MPRTRAILAVAFGVTALVLTGAGIHYVHAGRDWQRKLDQWTVDEPVRVHLSPSINGRYTAEFTQTCSIAHAQRLHIDPADGSPAAEPVPLARAFQRAEIAISARRLSGEEEPLSMLMMTVNEKDASSPVALIEPPPANGYYTLTIDINGVRDAETLPPLDLVVRNALCGLEAMPGTISTVLGVVSLFAAAVAGVSGAGLGISLSTPLPPRGPFH